MQGHARVFIDGVETADKTGIWQSRGVSTASAQSPFNNDVLFAWQWAERFPRRVTHHCNFSRAYPMPGGWRLHPRCRLLRYPVGVGDLNAPRAQGGILGLPKVLIAARSSTGAAGFRRGNPSASQSQRCGGKMTPPHKIAPICFQCFPSVTQGSSHWPLDCLLSNLYRPSPVPNGANS